MVFLPHRESDTIFNSKITAGVMDSVLASNDIDHGFDSQVGSNQRLLN
jgi:hypothetical protein